MSATEEPVVEPEPVVVVTPSDPVNRLLATAGLALAAIALAEIVGTIVIGFAVKVNKFSFIQRQGYAFLTQLEKSPVGLMLVVASVFAALAAARAARDRSEEASASYASWLVVIAAVFLGLGTILAVVARFRVADLVNTQPVDAITRRVLVVFVIRNFGCAVIALLIAVGAAFQRTRPRASV